MVWILIIVAVVIWSIFAFQRDRNAMLKKQVDSHGGMLEKYKFLVDKLTEEQSSRIIGVTRDNIHIRSQNQTASTDYIIMENFDETRIEWIGRSELLGTHKHEWKYPSGYSQEQIILDICNYMEERFKDF